MRRRAFSLGRLATAAAIASSSLSLAGCGSNATPAGVQMPSSTVTATTSRTTTATTTNTTPMAPTLIDFGAYGRRVTDANPSQPQLVGIPADLQAALATMWHGYATGGICTPSSADIALLRWSSAGYALISGSDCGVGGLAVLSKAGGTWHQIFGANGVTPCSQLSAAQVPPDVWNGRNPQPSCTDASAQIVVYGAAVQTQPTSTDSSWTTYTTYRNGVYGYHLDVPTALGTLIPINPVGVGVIGMNFRNSNSTVELSTHAQNNPGGTLAAQQAKVESELTGIGGHVTYSPLLSDGYVVSGTDPNGFITYERDFVFSKVTYTMVWTYPTSLKGQLDAAVTHSFATFVPGPNVSR